MKLQRSLAAEAEAAREARAKVSAFRRLERKCLFSSSKKCEICYNWRSQCLSCKVQCLSCKVIVAEGEIKASLALRQAAENIAGSPESLQVISSPSIIV